jgi:electron transport complex protein RnfC
MVASLRQLWPFHGGLKIPGNKAASTQEPLGVTPVPPMLVHPMSQSMGTAADPIVEVGETVKRGQPIGLSSGYVGAPVHAGSSGRVIAIENRPVAHPSGLDGLCVVIKTDGKDEDWGGFDPLTNYRTLNAAAIRARVRDCGIVGLGGATFPTSVKLNAGVGLQALILNGAECESYISCDDMLLRNRASEVIAGAQIMLHALEITLCLIAIEDDKPEALEALNEAVDEANDSRLEVVTVPAIYPEGGERQLIEVLTGMQVPSEGIPADIGFLVQNVGTAAAVSKAILDGQSLTSRIVTVTGDGVAKPCNMEVRIGTPIADVIAHCGGYTDAARHLVMGGAMMGFSLDSDEAPVTKATNCLLVASSEDIRPKGDAMACIRCGDCAQVCPANLMPQHLYWHARAEEFDKAEKLYLFDCIECGCCDQVCPSHIPLTEYFRYAKTEIWSRERDRSRAQLAQRRYDERLHRLDRIKSERKIKLAAKTRRLGGGPDQAPVSEAERQAVIDEVMQRVRNKNDRRSDEPPESG